VKKSGDPLLARVSGFYDAIFHRLGISVSLNFLDLNPSLKLRLRNKKPQYLEDTAV
jgi:hypothetical protein